MVLFTILMLGVSTLDASATTTDETMSLLQVAAKIKPVSTLSEDEATIAEWANALEEEHPSRKPRAAASRSALSEWASATGEAPATNLASFPWPLRRKEADRSNENKEANESEDSKEQLKATDTKAKKKHKSNAKHSSSDFDFENLSDGGLSAEEAIAALDAMLHDNKDLEAVHLGDLDLADDLEEEQDKLESSSKTDKDKSHHHLHHGHHRHHHHHNATSAADHNAISAADEHAASLTDDNLTSATDIGAKEEAAEYPEPPAVEEPLAVESAADAVAETLGETPVVAEEPGAAVEPDVQAVEQPVDPIAEAVQAEQPPTRPVAPNGPMEQEVLRITSGKLNQGGYMKIANLHNTTLMASYIRLAVAANGGTIHDDDSLLGFAPYHSGERGVQSYIRMMTELRKETWTTLGKAGSDVPLDQDGYQSIVDTKDSAKMASFIGRVVSLYGGSLTAPEKLTWFSKYHSGEKTSQSFKQLISQLRKVDWVAGMERDNMKQS